MEGRIVAGGVSLYTYMSWALAYCYCPGGYLIATSALFFIVCSHYVKIAESRYISISTFKLRRYYTEQVPEISQLVEPYECVNMSGDLRVCTEKGAVCEGWWKPPRAHHCSVCGLCQEGFDHHCSWVSVSARYYPSIDVFLIIT